MLGGLIAVALLAGVCAYVVGYAFVAPAGSFLRTRSGGLVLAGCVLTALALPSTLSWMVSARVMGPWPRHLGPEGYRVVWVAAEASGLLTGLRVWRMRFRGGFSRVLTFDESPVGRVQGQLPLADSLESALDVLGREAPALRDSGQLADPIRSVGRRFWHQLPEKNGEVYSLVRSHVPATIASDVTRLLLEGAQRKRRA